MKRVGLLLVTLFLGCQAWAGYTYQNLENLLGRGVLVQDINDSGDLLYTQQTYPFVDTYIYHAQSGSITMLPAYEIDEHGRWGDVSVGNRMNNVGHAVGYQFSQYWGSSLPCAWLGTGQPMIFQDQAIVHAVDINDQDEVALNGASTAFRWDPTLGLQLLEIPINGRSYSVCISQQGWIGGHATTENWENFPCIWDRQGAIHPLPTFGGNDGEVSGINDFGVAAGSARAAGSNYLHACIWKNGQIIPLVPGARSSRAFAINNQEMVAGILVRENGQSAPFVWDPVQGLQVLPVQHVGWEGWITGINNQGSVVGYYYDRAGTHSFKWTKS